MAHEGLAEFNEQNFDSDVIGHSGLTIVDFWADRCVPCRQLAKVLTQMAPEVPDNVQIGTVKAEDNIALLDRYGIRSTPTLLFIKDGELVETGHADNLFNTPQDQRTEDYITGRFG